MRTILFISYSHKDDEWLKDPYTQLQEPLLTSPWVELRNDMKTQVGYAWREEIHEALDSASKMILLIGAGFSASDFITKEALTPLLAAGNKGINFWPLIPSSFLFGDIEDFARFQKVNRLTELLIELNKDYSQAVEGIDSTPADSQLSQSQSTFNLPLPENRLFNHCEEIAEWLDTGFKSRERVHVLNSLGGAGKTHAAQQWAYLLLHRARQDRIGFTPQMNTDKHGSQNTSDQSVFILGSLMKALHPIFYSYDLDIACSTKSLAEDYSVKTKLLNLLETNAIRRRKDWCTSGCDSAALDSPETIADFLINIFRNTPEVNCAFSKLRTNCQKFHAVTEKEESKDLVADSHVSINYYVYGSPLQTKFFHTMMSVSTFLHHDIMLMEGYKDQVKALFQERERLKLHPVPEPRQAPDSPKASSAAKQHLTSAPKHRCTHSRLGRLIESYGYDFLLETLTLNEKTFSSIYDEVFPELNISDREFLKKSLESHFKGCRHCQQRDLCVKAEIDEIEKQIQGTTQKPVAYDQPDNDIEDILETILCSEEDDSTYGEEGFNFIDAKYIDLL